MSAPGISGDSVRLYVDPVCPWCWVTAKWIRGLAGRGLVTVQWAVLSMELVNRHKERYDLARKAAPSALALRTAVVVGQRAGNQGIERFYAEIGARVHEHGQDVASPVTVADSLEASGLTRSLADTAAEDDGTWDQVVQSYDELAARARVHGVPAIALDGGEGPIVFGPVFGEEPAPDVAAELWRHVVGLARHDAFFELKRHRTMIPGFDGRAVTR